MKVKNVSKGLIVLSVKAGKGYRAISIPAGKTVEDENIKQSDVDIYAKEKSLEVVETPVLKGGDNYKKNLDPVVLPDEVTADTLKELSVDDLKRWCKENKVTKYSKLKEDELISLILETLEASKDEGKGEE